MSCSGRCRYLRRRAVSNRGYPLGTNTARMTLAHRYSAPSWNATVLHAETVRNVSARRTARWCGAFAASALAIGARPGARWWPSPSHGYHRIDPLLDFRLTRKPALPNRVRRARRRRFRVGDRRRQSWRADNCPWTGAAIAAAGTRGLRVPVRLPGCRPGLNSLSALKRRIVGRAAPAPKELRAVQG